MITPRFRELMIQGYALSNKLHFGEWNPGEFDQWVQDCRTLLSRCEPEPEGFPWFPSYRHIEEIVFLLQRVRGQILRGQRQYLGLI